LPDRIAGAGGAPARVALIVQARMTSTRLPGKVLTPVMGRPLLAYELERLRDVTRATSRIVATTVNEADDAIVPLADAEGFLAVRGSELDVLDRFAQAVRITDAQAVVRVTADCPLIDPDVVDEVIGRYLAGGVDYVSNTQERTYPRGLDVEVFSAAALLAAAADARTPAQREHVTPFLYQNRDRFRIAQVRQPDDMSGERWTVDVREDLDLVRRVLEALYPSRPGFRMADVVALLNANPTWRAINRHVDQRSHVDAQSH
jgi:spore coat polysaccharide biosynthesis protein SpsF